MDGKETIPFMTETSQHSMSERQVHMRKTKNQRTKKPIYNFHDIISEEFLSHEVFMGTWNDFVRHRLRIKKPLTKLSAKRIFNMFHKENDNCIDCCIDSLSQSIANGWQGVFPV